MQREEFRNEIHQYIDQVYSDFQAVQDRISEMYSIVHEIFKKNSIHFYYGFGSLLGIVRDKGMIPWDADIDILIPISDAKRSVEILQKELPEDYYVVSNFIDRDYYLCESRVCHKNHNPEVFHVDIFYLIGAPSDPDVLKRFDERVKRVFYYRAIRNQPISKGNTRRSRMVYYIKSMLKFFMHTEPNILYNKRCNDMLFKYDISKSEYCIVWAVGGEIFPTSIFEPPIIYEKDGFECYLPNNPDEFLRIRYSNYNEYLPVSNRFEEFYAGYKRLRETTRREQSEIE